MQRITDAFIRSVKPTDKLQQFKDPDMKQFGFWVTKGGAKTFFVSLGSGKRQTIGRYPQITLLDARQEAKHRLAEIPSGHAKQPAYRTLWPFRDT